MWLIFAFLSVLSYAAADLLGKKKMDSGGKTASLEMLVSFEALAFLLSLVLAIGGFGESGQTPWRLLADHPLIWGNLLGFVLYWLLFLFSMRYVGLSMEEAFSGSHGIFYFVGLFAVNLATGALSAVEEMLHPLRLIPVLVTLIFVAILPNTEILAQRRIREVLVREKQKRRRMVIGLCLLLLALAIDAADSLITAMIFEESALGWRDYFMVSQLTNILPMALFTVFLRIKNKKFFIPLLHSDPYSLGYAVSILSSVIFYMVAASMDAVRTGILFTAYPVFPILGAQLLLKEKCTWRQHLCIWIIVAASIVFCLADYLL